MAGIKISNLPPIVTPLQTDVFPVSQSGVTYKETVAQLGTLMLLLTGGTMSGNLTLAGDPTTALMAATKQYVDAIATGLNVQASCVAASTAALTVTYNNGVSGVGATLTNAAAMAAFSIDGQSPTVGQRVLIKNQASALQNGIYTVTTVGSGAANWVLTRATDYDTPTEITPGDFVLVLNGTVNAQTQWVQTATVTTVGTDAITWDQFGLDINAIQTAIQNNTYIYCEDTGAADAYVATPAPAITSYVEGLLIILDPDNANATATPTLNVSGLGVKTITNNLGGALVAGDIVASQRLYLLYDGTNFRLINRNYEKRIQDESFSYILDTGAADAYVATLVPAATAYVTGQRLSLKIANANLTTTPTVNVNALGAKTITHTNGNAVLVGDLPAGLIADLRYDGTNFQLLNPAIVINKVATQTITATGAFTYTATAGTKYAIFELQGGGGGTGSAGGAGGQGSCVGGGGSGGYLKILVSGAANLAAITGSVGIAGAAGASGGNDGVNGGDTTLVINGGTTWTAGGGGRTVQAASSAAASSAAGGLAGTTTAGTNGTTILDEGGYLGGYSTIGATAGNPQIQGNGAISFLNRHGRGGTGVSNATGANVGGDAGIQGVVVVTEFISI